MPGEGNHVVITPEQGGGIVVADTNPMIAGPSCTLLTPYVARCEALFLAVSLGDRNDTLESATSGFFDAGAGNDRITIPAGHGTCGPGEDTLLWSTGAAASGCEHQFPLPISLL
jgi:hypothetical protein